MINHLRYLFPAFAGLLRGQKVGPKFIECEEHSVRNTVLEILNRLVNSSGLRVSRCVLELTLRVLFGSPTMKR